MIANLKPIMLKEAESPHLGSHGNDAGTGRYNIYTIQNNQNREDTLRVYRYAVTIELENVIKEKSAKCTKYCRSGHEGCGSGFRECQLLHSVLCRNYLKSRECYDKDCTLALLKGTIRKPVKEEFHNRYPRLDQRNILYHNF